jgi:hypothetical protein
LDALKRTFLADKHWNCLRKSNLKDLNKMHDDNAIVYGLTQKLPLLATADIF